jgi:transcription antitermination factor NusG
MLFDLRQNWYTAYTFPNLEMKVYGELLKQNVEAYLPVQKVVRQWSDRKKKLTVPLFPSYIFINTDQKRRYELLDIKGILRFVSFGGKPAIISNDDIVSIQRLENEDFEIEPNLVEGDNVIIRHGPFTGLKGKLFNKKGKQRFGVRLNTINQSLSIDISASCVGKIGKLR